MGTIAGKYRFDNNNKNLIFSELSCTYIATNIITVISYERQNNRSLNIVSFATSESIFGLKRLKNFRGVEIYFQYNSKS